MIAVGKSGYFNAGRLRELFKSHDDDYSGTLDYGECARVQSGQGEEQKWIGGWCFA